MVILFKISCMAKSWYWNHESNDGCWTFVDVKCWLILQTTSYAFTPKIPVTGNGSSDWEWLNRTDFFFMIWCCRWTNRAVATAWCCLPPHDMDLYGCVCGYRVKNIFFFPWSFWTNAPKKDETMSRKKSGPDCLWIHPAAFRTSSSFSFRKKKKHLIGGL